MFLYEKKIRRPVGNIPKVLSSQMKIYPKTLQEFLFPNSQTILRKPPRDVHNIF